MQNIIILSLLLPMGLLNLMGKVILLNYLIKLEQPDLNECNLKKRSKSKCRKVHQKSRLDMKEERI